jgi:hypothetical protein
MPNENRFVVANDSKSSAELFIEPYGASFALGPGEEVTVTDVFTNHPVTVKLGLSAQGDRVVSLWPGDGEMKVEKGGIDVLDLLQKGL